MTVPSKRIVPSLWPWPLTYEGKLLFSELSTILYVSYIHFRSIYLLIAEIKYQNIDLHLEFDEDGKLLTRLYDKRGDFDFPIVNYPYLSSNIPESLLMVSLFHRWYVMLGFVRNMKIFCSEDLFWFQSYWSRDILHGNFRLFFGNYMVVIQTLFTNLTPLWHMTGFQLFWIHRDGCHMWGRKCSLFPEHLVALPLGSSWFHTFIIYTLQICQSKDYVYGLMTGLYAWISLDGFVVDLFYCDEMQIMTKR